jgi:hypothetical protein
VGDASMLLAGTGGLIDYQHEACRLADTVRECAALDADYNKGIRLWLVEKQGFRWDDTGFGIVWPLSVSVISGKDANFVGHQRMVLMNAELDAAVGVEFYQLTDAAGWSCFDFPAAVYALASMAIGPRSGGLTVASTHRKQGIA